MSRHFQLYTINSFIPEKQYLLRFLEGVFNIKVELCFHDQKKYVFKSNESEVFAFPDLFFSQHNETDHWKKEDLPKSLYDFENFEVVYGSELGIDFFGDIFFCLTRWEERVDGLLRDKWGRVIEEQLFMCKSGLYKKPHVNELIAVLAAKLNLNVVQRSSQLILSHDIDQIKKYKSVWSWSKLLLGNIIKRKSLKWFFKDAYYGVKVLLFNDKDPYFKGLETFVNIAKDFDLRNEYFLLRKGNFNSDYEFEELQSVLNTENIGLHNALGSLNNNNMDEEDLYALRMLFNQPINKMRYHFLASNTLSDLGRLQKMGVKEDSSLYFTNHPGFRCGICHEFEWFDVLERKSTGVVEYPITFMDTSSLHLNWSKEQTLKYIESLSKYCKKYQGTFVLLWHNTSFFNWEYNDSNATFFRKVVERITLNLRSTN